MKIGCLLLRRLLKKKFLREVLLPLFFGLLIGYLIGTLYTSKSKEEDAHAHSFVKEVELGSYEYANGSYFFLRCLVLVHPDAKKPLSFIMAIRDTYGQQCNQTIFYTANPEVQRRVNDQQVYLIQQNSNGFYWNFFRTALKHSSTVPAMWTIVLDEQVFLKVSNLRRTLVNFDFRDKALLGRVMESTVFNLFPFMSNARLSLQAGIVMSNSALQSLLLCDHYILPRTTEKTILECSQEHGITVIDPVDEARMHLFHYRDVKSLISNSQDGGHSCCSDHAVTFGQHSFKEIRMAHYASETWVVFGTHGVMEVNKTYAIDRSLLVRTTTLKPKTTVPTKKPDTKKAVVKKEEPKKEKPKKKPGLL